MADNVASFEVCSFETLLNVIVLLMHESYGDTRDHRRLHRLNLVIFFNTMKKTLLDGYER